MRHRMGTGAFALLAAVLGCQPGAPPSFVPTAAPPTVTAGAAVVEPTGLGPQTTIWGEVPKQCA